MEARGIAPLSRAPDRSRGYVAFRVTLRRVSRDFPSESALDVLGSRGQGASPPFCHGLFCAQEVSATYLPDAGGT